MVDTNPSGIRIIFPAEAGVGEVVVPMAAITFEEPYQHKDGSIIQLVKAGEWSLERTLDDAGRTVTDGEDDGNDVFVMAALSAWLSWYAWLKHEQQAAGN